MTCATRSPWCSTYSEFLLGDASEGLNSEQTRFIQAMKRNSEFMLRLINDLLDVSKIESGKVQLELAPVDLGQIVEQKVAITRWLAHKKMIEIKVELRRRPDRVAAGRAQDRAGPGQPPDQCREVLKARHPGRCHGPA